jgi:predicted AAA+ superfamily ATPase
VDDFSRLMNIRDFNQLHGSHWLGASWETYVIEEIIRVGGKSFEYSSFRTQTGAEVDLVMRNPSGKIILIEIKYSTNPTPSRGFHSAVADLDPVAQYVIVPEGESWESSKTLMVCGLSWFLKQEIGRLEAMD